MRFATEELITFMMHLKTRLFFEELRQHANQKKLLEG
jgi:hypothetical protein